MEAEDHNHSYYLNLFEKNTSQTINLNSIFLPNPHVDDHDEEFHVQHGHGHYHQHQQASVVIDDEEKRLRRMVSNRESARRSQMRKKMQIEELQMQVEKLMASNHYLREKVISLLENNHHILQENAQLKDNISYFHQIRMDNVMLLPGNINGFDITQQQSTHQSTW